MSAENPDWYTQTPPPTGAEPQSLPILMHLAPLAYPTKGQGDQDLHLLFCFKNKNQTK